jgi:predicted ATP-grasp superfamily ATP-dependent carboligase
MFAAHADACAQGTLPSIRPETAGPGAVGKAIVYARHNCEAGDTEQWLADPMMGDIPQRGEQFRAGHPICTVFAAAADAAQCYTALVLRAARVYAEVNARLTPSTV